MKALNSMIRLQRWQLEEKRRQLVRLEEREAAIVASQRALENELQNEQQAIRREAEFSFCYGNYAQSVIEKRKTLISKYEALETVLLEARSEVGQTYQEVRRYEIVLDNLEERLNKERLRVEQQDIDDISLEMYRRAEV